MKSAYKHFKFISHLTQHYKLLSIHDQDDKEGSQVAAAIPLYDVLYDGDRMMMM